MFSFAMSFVRRLSRTLVFSPTRILHAFSCNRHIDFPLLENSDESIQDCFQRFVANSDIQDEINAIDENQDAMERYIHDFVHMNCKPVKPGEDEVQNIIQCILNNT